MFAFDSMQSAIEAVTAINNSYDSHARAAKEIAREYFDSNIVLNQMLEQLN